MWIYDLLISVDNCFFAPAISLYPASLPACRQAGVTQLYFLFNADPGVAVCDATTAS